MMERDVAYWPVTTLAEMQQFGSDRGEGGPSSCACKPTKMTQRS
jgi:hypothetical protein